MEPHRAWLTVDGNCIYYPWDVSTSTADLTNSKLLFNSIISTPQAQFFTLDIKNFYLKVPLDRPEYMYMHLDIMPAEVVENITYINLQRVMGGSP